MSFTPPLADRSSRYPIAQQVVGALTVTSNTIKLASDIIKTIYNFVIKLISGFTEDPKLFQKKLLVKTYYIDHSQYILLGLGRFTPIVGTILSIYRCEKYRREHPKDESYLRAEAMVRDWKDSGEPKMTRNNGKFIFE